MFDGSGGDDSVSSISIDSAGNIYAGGYGVNLIDKSSGYDWWIKKFDSNGVEDIANWDLKFDGNNGSDAANSIVIDSVGNVYAAGYGWNLVDTSSEEDWWIKKFIK